MENKERWNKDQTARGHMRNAKHVIPILNAKNGKVDKIKPEILTINQFIQESRYFCLQKFNVYVPKYCINLCNFA